MRLLLFLVLNFGALYVGALLMNGSPATNEWYQQLDKAPWTPPGWFFGLAWTTIMICYSIYMNILWKTAENKKRLIFLYSVQWLLNVVWNPVFFAWHQTLLGCFVIFSLIIILLYKHKMFSSKSWITTLLLLPYVLWLCVALSLNVYVV
jgi:tryptophan-rich sensory protein